MQRTTDSKLVSATTSDVVVGGAGDPRGHWVLRSSALLAVVVFAIGLITLKADPGAGFRLEVGDGIPTAAVQLREETGGDEVFTVLLHHPNGLMNAAGVSAIKSVHGRLQTLPEVAAVESVWGLSLPGGASGAFGAVRPLEPAPSGSDAWASVDSLLRGHPLVAGSLLSSNGRLARVVVWPRREGVDAGALRRASSAADSGPLAGTDVGAAVQAAVGEARMAVALGEAEGPPDRAAWSALDGLVAEWPDLGPRLQSWREAAELAAGAPLLTARPALIGALDDLSVGTGIAVLPLSQGLVQDAVEAAARGSLKWFLAAFGALVFLVGLFGRRPLLETLGLLGLPLIGCAAGLGLSSWLGGTLHATSALAIPLVVLAAWAWLCCRPHSRVTRGFWVTLALAGLPLMVWPAPGPIDDLRLALFGGWIASWLVLTAFAGHQAHRFHTPEDPALAGSLRWVGLGGGLRTFAVLGLSAALGLLLVWLLPFGLDPARALVGDSEVAQALQHSEREFGSGPLLLRLEAEEGTTLQGDAGLGSLHRLEDHLASLPFVLATQSLRTVLTELHRAVSGVPGAEFPDEGPLAEQYLFLFGRPQALRPFVGPGGVAGAIHVQLRRDFGPSLGAWMDAWVRDPSAWEGAQPASSIAALTLSVHRQSKAWAEGFCLSGVLLGILLLFGPLRSQPKPEAASVFLLALVSPVLLAVGVSGLAAGAVGVDALAAGLGCGLLWVLSWGSPCAVRRRVFVGAMVVSVPLVLSAAGGIHALGLGLQSGLALAFLSCLGGRLGVDLGAP